MAKRTKYDVTLLGEIRADSAYPLPFFKRIAGMSDRALRTARRRGLIVRRSGARAFVLGRDFHEFLLSSSSGASGKED